MGIVAPFVETQSSLTTASLLLPYKYSHLPLAGEPVTAEYSTLSSSLDAQTKTLRLYISLNTLLADIVAIKATQSSNDIINAEDFRSLNQVPRTIGLTVSSIAE